jgi:thiol-disulfide isomerase/thioredoxin
VNALAVALALTGAVALGDGDLSTVSGKPFDLADLLTRGPVVLVFWNSWLPHSDEFAKLIPEVETAAQRYKWPGAVVVFQEEDTEPGRKLVKKDSPLELLFDRRGELVRRFKVTRAPTVLLVEPNGEVRARSGPGVGGVHQIVLEMEHR